MQFDDPLMRNMIWQTLWHMVEDGTLALPDFLQLALQFGAAEHDPRTLASILCRIAAAFDLALRIGAAGGLPVAVPELMQQLRRDAWWEVLTAAAASDSQKIWLDHYLRIAEGAKRISRSWRDYWARIGKRSAGASISHAAGRCRLSRGRRLPGALQLAQAERARDPSSSGGLPLARSRGSTTGAALKGAMLERLIGGQADNTAAAPAIMNHLSRPRRWHCNGYLPLACPAALALLDSTRSEYFMADYVRLFPGLCDTASAQLLAGSPCLFRTARQTGARWTSRSRCARRQ
ncbi:MAG: hypothetical protein IPO61_07295 [Gammaproteobacteria bacterium]|nr:hypothetical protein [Gammaproteobacteria bacterium]